MGSGLREVLVEGSKVAPGGPRSPHKTFCGLMCSAVETDALSDKAKRLNDSEFRMVVKERLYSEASRFELED